MLCVQRKVKHNNSSRVSVKCTRTKPIQRHRFKRKLLAQYQGVWVGEIVKAKDLNTRDREGRYPFGVTQEALWTAGVLLGVAHAGRMLHGVRPPETDRLLPAAMLLWGVEVSTLAGPRAPGGGAATRPLRGRPLQWRAAPSAGRRALQGRACPGPDKHAVQALARLLGVLEVGA